MIRPSSVMNERLGDWMQTYTGRQFWPMDPRADEVFIEDIAHSLAHQCRYAGHCRRFYSVAEHCVLMAFRAAPAERLWALLHDSSEAYLVDVPRPVKPYLIGYKEAEQRVMEAICKRYGLAIEMPVAVKALDEGILADEKHQNMAPCAVGWYLPRPALGVTLRFWQPDEAEAKFLTLFENLSGISPRSERSFAPPAQDDKGEGVL